MIYLLVLGFISLSLLALPAWATQYRYTSIYWEQKADPDTGLSTREVEFHFDIAWRHSTSWIQGSPFTQGTFCHSWANSGCNGQGSGTYANSLTQTTVAYDVTEDWRVAEATETRDYSSILADGEIGQAYFYICCHLSTFLESNADDRHRAVFTFDASAGNTPIESPIIHVPHTVAAQLGQPLTFSLPVFDRGNTITGYQFSDDPDNFLATEIPGSTYPGTDTTLDLNTATGEISWQSPPNVGLYTLQIDVLWESPHLPGQTFILPVSFVIQVLDDLHNPPNLEYYDTATDNWVSLGTTLSPTEIAVPIGFPSTVTVRGLDPLDNTELEPTTYGYGHEAALLFGSVPSGLSIADCEFGSSGTDVKDCRRDISWTPETSSPVTVALRGYDFRGANTSLSFNAKILARSRTAGLAAIKLVPYTDPPPEVVSLTSANTPTNNSVVDFDVTFSESVTDFDSADDVQVNHSGTAHTGISISGGPTDYTVSVQGVSGDGSLSLSVLNDASPTTQVSDNLGQTLSASETSSAIQIDNTAPTVATTSVNGTGPTNADSLEFSVEFSEDVVNLDSEADLQLNASGISWSGVTFSGGPRNYTLTVNDVSGEGSLSIGIDTGSDVVDAAGNALASSDISGLISIDTTAPTASAPVTSATTPTNANTISFDLSFSEDVQNFDDESDLLIAHNGTSHSVVNISGGPKDYTVTIDGLSGEGDFTLAANLSSDITDLVGNELQSNAISNIISVDTEAPSAQAPTTTQTLPSNSDTLTFDLSFTEDVQQFDDVDDLVITHNGTAHTGLAITGGPQDYSLELSGLSGDGTFTIAANTGSDIVDDVGNALISSNSSAAIQIDNTSPQLTTISSPGNLPSGTDSVNFTVSFDEVVAGFDSSSDVSLSHTGTTHDSVTISGGPTDFTVSVSGLSGTGTFTLALDAGNDVLDSAGNPLIASITAGIATLLAPVIPINSSDSDEEEEEEEDEDEEAIPMPSEPASNSSSSPILADDDNVTLSVDDRVRIGLEGGTPPYSAEVGDDEVAEAVISGDQLVVEALMPGSTSVSVFDAGDGELEIEVTVEADVVTVDEESTVDVNDLPALPTVNSQGEVVGARLGGGISKQDGDGFSTDEALVAGDVIEIVISIEPEEEQIDSEVDLFIAVIDERFPETILFLDAERRLHVFDGQNPQVFRRQTLQESNVVDVMGSPLEISEGDEGEYRLYFGYRPAGQDAIVHNQEPIIIRVE